MRIVGGRLRGRRLDAPEGGDTRPTSDRVRESLFDMLEHRGWHGDGESVLRGATVLDAFAGTGALGLEALSRGAKQATFFERDRAALGVLRANIAACRADGESQVLDADAVRPPRAQQSCSLAFLDAPYGKDLTAAALTALLEAGWIAPRALCCIELAKSEAFNPPSDFEAMLERVYGRTRLVFLMARDA